MSWSFVHKFDNKINGAGLNFTDAKDRQLAMDIAIKCGDINNASKPNEIATKWSYLIMEEFFAQVSRICWTFELYLFKNTKIIIF